MMNIGVIGVGSKQFTISHLKLLIKDENINLHTGCDIDEDKAKKCLSIGFKNYTTNYLEILENKDINIVYLTINSKQHEIISLEALNHGKHVFMEKPPGNNTDNMIQNYKLAKEKKLIIFVGFNRFFYPSIKKILEDIIIDDITNMEFTFHKSRSWQIHKSNTSWLSESGIHQIYLISKIMNSLPFKMFVTSNNYGALETETKNYNAIFIWKNGVSCNYAFNTSCGVGILEQYSFHTINKTYTTFFDGTDCKLYIKQPETTFYKGGSSFTDIKVDDFTYDKEESYNFQKDEFISSIKNGYDKNQTYLWGIVAIFFRNLIESNFCGIINWPDNLLMLFSKDQQPDNIKEIILVNDLEYIKPHIHLIPTEYRVLEISKIKEKDTPLVVGTILTKFNTLPHTSHLPNLKIQGLIGCSLNSFKQSGLLLKNKNNKVIQIVNGSEAYADSVAEYILMLSIMGIRNASLSHEYMREGKWGFNKLSGDGVNYKTDLRNQVRGGNRNFQGCKVGIIGYGFITKKLLELLVPFKCNIKIHSSYVPDHDISQYNLIRSSLEALIADSDIVIINRGLTDRTKLFFGKDLIRLLKPGTVFINTSRAGLVDMKYLLHRLKKNDIFACLDVFDQEPLEEDNILRILPNVFLSSHISGNNAQMYQESIKTTITKVVDFLQGNHVKNIISTQEQIQNMT